MSGPLPDLSKCTDLQTLHLQNNKFSGSLEVLTACTALQCVEMQHNHFDGDVPDFSKCTTLKQIDLSNNNLPGRLPPSFPTSVAFFNVSCNPHLYGTISKAFIAQCGAINYSGCKTRADCATQHGRVVGEWMKGPFIVGVSFSSGDMPMLLANLDMFQISEGNFQDSPATGDPQYPMFDTHGRDWCSWQDVWLLGLQTLFNTTVYVLPTDAFRKKFENSDAYATEKQCPYALHMCVLHSRYFVHAHL